MNKEELKKELEEEAWRKHGQTFQDVMGFSRPFALDIIFAVFDAYQSSLLERALALKKESKLSIPDNGTFAEACDRKDIEYIVYYFQNTLTDGYNQGITNVINLIKEGKE